MSKLRLTALKALEKITDEGGYVQLVLSRTLETQRLSDQDKRLLSQLCYTTVVHLKPIDQLIGAYSKVPVSRLKREVRSALRIGICQIVYLGGIKPYAAVSETVDALKHTRSASFAGYVNGVLRHIARDLEAAPEGQRCLAGVDLEDILPSWIREKLTDAYGAERTRQLEQIMCTQKPVCIRLEAQSEEEKQDLLQKLQALVSPHPPAAEKAPAGKDPEGGCASREKAFRQGTIVPDAYYLARAQGIAGWPLFLDGKIYIQDESSMAACQVLLMLLAGEQLRQEVKVLDLCGAPGGKASMIAGRLGKRLSTPCGGMRRMPGGQVPSGCVLSRDLYAHRVALIRENADRLRLDNLSCEVKDATVSDPADKEAFDAVLLDAPCSGLGVVRTKPDILFFRKPDQIDELANLQREMLDNAALAVKKGGFLLYCTCTLLPEENQNQVNAFLKRHPEYTELDLQAYLPADCGIFEQHVTLLPEKEGHEGFFISAFQKTGSING